MALKNYSENEAVRSRGYDLVSTPPFFFIWEIPVVGLDTEFRAREAGKEPLVFGAVVRNSN